jgi:hypothetical protein
LHLQVEQRYQWSFIVNSFTEILSEMTAVADSYCQLIDRTGRAPGNWLEMLYEIMPRLHAAVTALNSYDAGDMTMDGVDLDERFELYSRLRKALGERDSYWLEFDATPEEIHMSGSLADDLTDIYFDLRHGLELVDEAWPHRAAQVWQSTYRLHWGQHLVDAERHLYALKVRNQLAFNMAS